MVYRATESRLRLPADSGACSAESSTDLRVRPSPVSRAAHAAFARSASASLAGADGVGRAERAVHLVDAVLPDVPVRQWVLTVTARCDISWPLRSRMR
jgi:hypothetical protein